MAFYRTGWNVPYKETKQRQFGLNKPAVKPIPVRCIRRISDPVHMHTACRYPNCTAGWRPRWDGYCSTHSKPLMIKEMQ